MNGISIVVPSYNQGQWLEQCLRSILDQGMSTLEVIVIDGGSIDQSASILKNYADRLAYWVSEKDEGQTHALLKGFARSTGSLMGWLNSDDYYEPGALQTVLREFDAHPEADVIYGDMRWVDPDGRPLRLKREIEFDLGILLWDHNYLPQPSTFWRRKIWESSGGLEKTLRCAMDFDLWLKFAARGARFRHIPAVLSNMRAYPEQKNQRLRAISNAEDHQLRENFLGRKVSRFERWIKFPFYKTRRIWRKLSRSRGTAS